MIENYTLVVALDRAPRIRQLGDWSWRSCTTGVAMASSDTVAQRRRSPTATAVHLPWAAV